MPNATDATHGLTWEEFGTFDGQVVLFFHGWPGSSRQGVIFHPEAVRLGCRVIAPNRPGIHTTPHVAGRTLRDWPGTVERLLDALHVEKAHVIGVSGGGPYALACAHALPERIHAAAIVCGAPPIASLADLAGLNPGYRALLHWFRRDPTGVRRMLCHAAKWMQHPDAEAFIHPARIFLPRPDAEAIESAEDFSVIFGCQRDAFANPDGLFHDAALYALPWGFALREIRIPVQYWHGHDDEHFTPAHTTQMAQKTPGSSLHLVPDEGHFSLPIRHAAPILQALLAVGKNLH